MCSIYISIISPVSKSSPSWWKVKIKGDSQDVDTAIGLVPAAYVEQVTPTWSTYVHANSLTLIGRSHVNRQSIIRL